MIASCLLMMLAASEPADDKKASAKELAAQANHAYTLGRFDEALDKYSRAYEAYSAPEFLFNIGQCHKNLHNYERAVFFFQGFLRQKPKTPNRKLVEDLIFEAEREAEEQRKAEAIRQGELAAASMQARPFQPDTELAQTPVYKRGWFWGVIGGTVAGVALVTTLAILLTPAQSRTADFPPLDLRAR